MLLLENVGDVTPHGNASVDLDNLLDERTS